MAEGNYSSGDYRCESCGTVVDLSKNDFFSDYDDIINDYLLEQEELYYYSDDQYSSKEEEVPVYVTCANEDCQDRIPINLLVQATPKWEYDDPLSDHVPKVVCFESRVLEVLPPDDHYIKLDIAYDSGIQDYKDLRIICRTKMNLNYCYMAYDENDQRLLRPIFNTQTNQCCWPKGSETSFDVGSLVTFKVLQHPDGPNDPKTPYPHASEDTVVDPDARPIPSTPWNVGSLEVITKQYVHEIFPLNLLLDNKYVLENSVCPSAGILLINEANLRFIMSYGKERLIIFDGANRFDFRITAEDFDKPQQNGSRKCFIMLGLGRPFSGTNGRVFNPPRCYVLVIGIKIVPDASQ